MNMQTIGASMKIGAAQLRKEWSKLTDDDAGLYEANQDEFFARLEKKQGIAREEAEKRINELKKTA